MLKVRQTASSPQPSPPKAEREQTPRPRCSIWYEDQKWLCRDCGQQFVWTAKKQQHWFEVLKLPIQVRALRCPTCSRKVRLAKAAQKAHMAEVARRPRHPNEGFFKSSSGRKAKSES